MRSIERRDSMKSRLSARRPLMGLLQIHPNPALAEMAAMCGYDFLILDGKHGPWSESDHLQALCTLASTDVIAMVRLAGHDASAVGRYLDMGADVIIAPNVDTAEQARTLVRAMHYPPDGTRGFGASGHRGTRYGLDLAAHLSAPRAGALFFPSIESARGAANVEEILAVDGVDGVFVIPSNLTADLGCFMDFSQPVYAQALAHIEQAAAACGKVVGTGPVPGYPLEALAARGHRLLIIGVDIPLIRGAMSAQVANARASMEKSHEE